MKSFGVVSHRKKECSLSKGPKVTVVSWDMRNVKILEIPII